MKKRNPMLLLTGLIVVLCAGMELPASQHPTPASMPMLFSDTLTALRPTGEIDIAANPLPVFEWAANFPYNGTFTLKILALNPNQPLPDSLPENGLFFRFEGLTGTSLAYPNDAPPLEVGTRYVWQVETDGLVSGAKQKSKATDFIPVPLINCFSMLSGTPTAPLCPGDCFTLTYSLPTPFFPLWSTYTHQFTVYADQPGVTANGVAAHPQSLLCNGFQPPQATVVSNSSAYSFEVCVQAGASDPIQISILYNRPATSCTMPCSPGCCYSTQSFAVQVADLSDYDDMALMVRDLMGNPVLEACAVSPLNFALLDAPFPGLMPVWQCLEAGVWQDLPGATGLAFTAAPATLFGLDCGGCTGSWDKQIRAKLVIPSTGAGPDCEWFSDVYALRVCCPLSPAATVTVTPNALLCEGDVVTFDVSLTSPDCFVQMPGGDVQIEWSLVGTGNIVGTENQTNFSYNDLLLGPADVCFQAIVTNCAGKSITVTGCAPVDPKPVCGVIVGSSPNLTEVFVDPITGAPLPAGDKAYTICPGKDAILEAVGFDLNTCTPTWEYSDDNGGTWQPVGSSTNTVQNTNTLFPPPSGACRYYRVVCLPLSNPSGCMPCISNVVRICQKAAPLSVLISNCDMDVCKGNPIALSVASPEPSVDYTWLCNGLEVGTGPSLNLAADKSACYWVEASNGCTVVESATCCVEVCETVASISCPQPPNECACLGEPITLTGSDSFSTCPPGNLTYQWSWLDANGNAQTSGNIDITDTPPIAGTTYTLIVTDLDTGCSGTAQLFIKPCVKL